MYNDNAATRAEPHASDGHVPAEEPRLVIESRFGTLAVAAHNSVAFPHGLLGFGEYRRYALAELADPRYPQFRVLQCLDNHELAFLVVALEPASGIVDPADLAAACAKLGFSEGDLAVLLIVTIRRTPDQGPHVSANLRAPLLIDTARRIGVQYVLPSESYPVRYPI